MTIRRASLLTPSRRLDELPSQLRGPAAAEFLAAWTVLWHPALIHKIGSLPSWYSAEEPPEPEALDAELILMPPASRERLAVDWHERLRAANSGDFMPIEALPSRAATLAATLRAASLSPDRVDAELVADFLALGYAHLQVELLTRAMRYTTLLAADEFRAAVMGAAGAAVADDGDRARDGLTHAFDLLGDARNHFYSVDFYLVDVTLLAATTLGEPLRRKLASGPPMNLLAPGDVLERLAREQPETLAELRRAINAGHACLTAGTLRGTNLAHRDPEGILGELQTVRDAHLRILDRVPTIFAQFGGSYSPLLPRVLKDLGFEGALLSAFDGTRCELPPQPKSRWGEPGGPSIDVLAGLPLDVDAPDTWLTLGQRIGDSLVRDHVATILLAGWPGQAREYYEDLRRIAAYSPVLGKFITLDDYFGLTAESDDWTSFHPHSYSIPSSAGNGDENRITSRVAAYQQHVFDAFDRLFAGLTDIVPRGTTNNRSDGKPISDVAINPWNFACPRYAGFDQLDCELRNTQSAAHFQADVPGLGYAAITEPLAAPAVPLAEGRTLRNEFLELVVSEATGGIQSLRSHRDRTTRVSQRLVMHDKRLRHDPDMSANGSDGPALAVHMIADKIAVTCNDSLVGEIESHGRLTDFDGQPLAEFVQTVRLVRGLPVAIVDVRLRCELPPEGSIWNSYFASRLAWRDEAVHLRHGVDWTARPTSRRRIDSSEWVDISDAVGNITCFALGLPYHVLAAATWLDTLLAISGETPQHAQFAIGLDCQQPAQTALMLLTAGRSFITNLPSSPPLPSGWFFHVSAKHVIVTDLEPLPPPRGGIRLRLLEAEGRAVRTSLTAFQPLATAQRTNFRGEMLEALIVVDGRVQFEIGPYGFVQIEANW
jgi:alpha-mannosidase